MDENDGGVGFGGYGDGGDTGDQFHRNEAISAVADDGFLGEEDDDYEDLYNDVNVGEGFLQSLRKNEDTGLENRTEPQAAASRPLPPVVSMVAETGGMSIPGIGGGGDQDRKYEGVGGSDGGSRATGVDLYQNQGFKGNDLAPKGPVAPAPGTNAGAGPAVGGYGVGGGLRVELSQSSNKVGEIEGNTGNAVVAQGMVQQPPPGMSGVNVGSDVVPRPIGGVANMNGSGGNVVIGGSNAISVGTGGGGGGGGTILFIGDLHWWTTDAELEAELVKYGPVKEVKFFDEKASGKSKGYCQVEFYDPTAATACKEGMNGHVFNGRPCVVAFASPYSVKRMGEAQVNRTQGMNQQSLPQNRRGPNEPISKPGGSSIATGTNYQGTENNNNNNNNNRGFGRGNWGRGNAQGMGGRGPLGPMRNRPAGMGGRGIMGNAGNGFGQGMGATPPMMHPQAMMGQGFDPAFGGPMGRMGSYGGFPGAPTPPFSGMMPSFPPVGSVGMHGVAPHVNPAFFGRGMPMNGMGMMPNAGLDGPNMGMWSDPSMGGWAGDEHGGRAAESSYGEEAASDHQYGEASHDRTNWPNSAKEKDRGSERDWSGSSERRYRDEREPGYDREITREKEVTHDQEWPERRHRDEREPVRDRERGDRQSQRDCERSRDRDRDHVRERDHDRERDRGGDRHREERDRHADHHRYRDREAEYDDDWDRGRSSRTHSKSRAEEEQRSRSRDVDYGKRRRITSE